MLLLKTDLKSFSELHFKDQVRQPPELALHVHGQISKLCDILQLPIGIHWLNMGHY